MERTGHEGVILHGVAEHHKLRAAETVRLTREVRRLLDDAAHARHGVHINARLRRADVHARADEIRLGQRLRNGAQEQFVALGKALLHECGIAADEVHTAGLGCTVERLCKGNIVLCLAAPGDEGDRRHGDALVDDRDAKLTLDVFARFHEVFGAGADLVVNLVAAALRILTHTVEQGDAHRDGADVKVLLVDHVDCVKNIL